MLSIMQPSETVATSRYEVIIDAGDHLMFHLSCLLIQHLSYPSLTGLLRRSLFYHIHTTRVPTSGGSGALPI